MGGKPSLRVRARVREIIFIELKLPEQIVATAKILIGGERFLDKMLPHLPSFGKCDYKNTETYRISMMARRVTGVPSHLSIETHVNFVMSLDLALLIINFSRTLV